MCSTKVTGASRILVDADACPVKDEVYRVAFRHGVAVKVVSNMRMRVPDHPLVERVVVSDAFDAADDWIAETASPSDVVITGDILLADRALKAALSDAEIVDLTYCAAGWIGFGRATHVLGVDAACTLPEPAWTAG